MDKRAAKRRRDKKDGSGNSMEDRLSELPQPILHHILSLLSLKEAVQTCVLSKTWRHLGPTRPKIDLCGICDKCVALNPGLRKNKICANCFVGNKKAFLSLLDKTLQRYHDQKLFTHEFRLFLLNTDTESISLLKKWVPKLITPYFAVNTFDIRFCQYGLPLEYFDLPSEVFHIKSLEKLCLQRCRLNQIDFVELNRLHTLSLESVVIADETLEKIISSCPLIENVALEWCEGLRIVKMINKHPNLKHLSVISYPAVDKVCEVVQIDNAPALETIKVVSCPNLFLHNKYLHNLKSLHLDGVFLYSDLFENFSSKFPCLEELDIRDCNHFDEFHLSSRSLKRLSFMSPINLKKATMDAPNILYFKFRGGISPSNLSFTNIPSECESHVEVDFAEDSYYDVSEWFVNLYQLLRALGQSQITLQTSHDRFPHHETIGGFDKPVLVEHLCLSLEDGYDYSSPSLPDFLNGLFRVCRPKHADVQYADIPFIDFLCTVLVREREQRTYHWQQDLEDVEMEFWDMNAKEWNPKTLEEFKLLNEEKIRFRLKWRDNTCSYFYQLSFES